MTIESIETSIVENTLFVTYRDKCVVKVVYEDGSLNIFIPSIATSEDEELIQELLEVRKIVSSIIISRKSDIYEILTQLTQQ